jgi:hypothetical protein
MANNVRVSFKNANGSTTGKSKFNDNIFICRLRAKKFDSRLRYCTLCADTISASSHIILYTTEIYFCNLQGFP